MADGDGRGSDRIWETKPSRIRSVPKQPAKLHARRTISPARRARILLRHGGACARLGCEIAEDLEIDHFICLALGGRDTDDNLEPLCKRHHAQKTARDRKLIAKVNRLIEGKSPTKRPIRSRGFDRTLRKTVEGRVVAREQPEDDLS